MPVIEVMAAPESAHTAVPDIEPADVILNGGGNSEVQNECPTTPPAPIIEVPPNLHIPRGSEGGMLCVVAPPSLHPLSSGLQPKCGFLPSLDWKRSPMAEPL